MYIAVCLQAFIVSQYFLAVAAAPSSTSTAFVALSGHANDAQATADHRSSRPGVDFTTGGPHGDVAWSDGGLVQGNSRIGQITLWCDTKTNQPLQAIQFDFRDNYNLKAGLIYGYPKGNNYKKTPSQVYYLAPDEMITSVELWTTKAGIWPWQHTRIESISFDTNKRRYYASCGPKKGKYALWRSEGNVLLFMSGRSGDVVDQLHGEFIATDTF